MAASLTVRPCEIRDLTEVADLFCRTFRPGHSGITAPVRDHLQEVYFDNPWYDPNSPSLVSEADGRVSGFFGVLPFPMRLGSRTLRAAIGGNFMVDPLLSTPFTGSRLIKAFFEQEHDLSMTDTSNETGRKSWESHGGVTLYPYSLQWLRVIHPAGFALAMARKKKQLRPVTRLVSPFARFGDRLLTRSRLGLPAAPENWETRPLTAEVLQDGFRLIEKTIPLQPAHTPATLEWLLAAAAEKREFGPLVGRALYAGNKLAGWYLYYPNAGKWGQVLQWMARPGQSAPVFRHLLHDAAREGSTALMGRVHPMQLPELTEHGCHLLNRHTYTQFRTADSTIRDVIMRNAALLTRFEGEWWTRFQNDSFREPPTDSIYRMPRPATAASAASPDLSLAMRHIPANFSPAAS